jgi:hypothetical protein
LQFPARADDDAWRRNRDRRQSAADCQTGLTALLDSVVQTNVRTMQAMLRLTNPVRWIELQQRAAQEYMTVVIRANLALLGAMTNVVAGSAAAGSVQTVSVPLSQTRR